MRTSRTTPVIFTLILSGILIYGCTRNSGVLDPEFSAYPFAATPDVLMENFEQAYTSMDLAEYGKLLHEDFIFSFHAADVKKLGLSRDHYTRADELASAAHMFARKPHEKSDGRVIPPILDIEFLVFERDGNWESADDPDRPGTSRATYRVRIRFDRGEAGVIVVGGSCVFYAVDAGDAGHQLIGWVDRTARGG